MNSRNRAFASLSCALALVSISTFSSALADDMTDGSMTQQQSGEMGGEAREQMNQAKMTLAPHTVTIESSLAAALEQVRGLKNGLKISEDRSPNPTTVKHLQMIGKEMTEDLRMAKVHQGELQAGVKKFPEIAASSDYRQVNSAVSEVETFSSTFQSNLSSNEYWRNPQKVMGDLDNLERRLNKAIDETKSFSSSQLDFSFIG